MYLKKKTEYNCLNEGISELTIMNLKKKCSKNALLNDDYVLYVFKEMIKWKFKQEKRMAMQARGFVCSLYEILVCTYIDRFFVFATRRFNQFENLKANFFFLYL